ncbi:hypothetical protein NDU88_001214 [Pleurodeles waltl]|uniref:Uncharacterized protein n=1 Tax=Pleurodeles waltl TaxID=8319 RepID=A0AAV7UTM7_PLEWA|nr:hypothetical protein NDU88_001214 [Pleurodeles waltl]
MLQGLLTTSIRCETHCYRHLYEHLSYPTPWLPLCGLRLPPLLLWSIPHSTPAPPTGSGHGSTAKQAFEDLQFEYLAEQAYKVIMVTTRI